MTSICVFCDKSADDVCCVGCIKLPRKQQFVRLLHNLQQATTKANPHDALVLLVKQIQHVRFLFEPIIYIPLKSFNPLTQNIDKIAQTYLFQCRGINSTEIVPIATHANGNCLYNSVLSLMPSLYVSPIELRVRTIIELATNQEEYARNYTQNVGPLQDCWKTICKDYSYSDLYELAALCNVLGCNIRSLYPRIDYHSYFEIYDHTFRPNVLTDNEITILWCHTKIEAEARTYNKGNWLPNHFVPILLLSEATQSATAVQTNHRNLTTSSSDVSPLEKSSVELDASLTTTTESEIIILDDSYSEVINNVGLPSTTMTLPITKVVRRLSRDAIRKRTSRSLETSNQTALRLSKQRDLKLRNRMNETEEQVTTRLTKDSSRKAFNRLALNELEKYQRIQKDNIRRRARTKERKTKPNSWPSVISYDYKCQCLENFTNLMSKSNLTELTCALCNTRVLSQHMNGVSMIKLKDKLFLRPHMDIATTIPGHENLFIDDENNMETDFHKGDFSYTSPQNVLLYRKGIYDQYDDEDERVCLLCTDCHLAFSKEQIPKFCAANKMWIGDVPEELKDLTIVEEKLIAIYRHNSCVIKLQSPFHSSSTSQSALKGNAITFPQNVPNIASSLPLAMSTLCDTIKVIFIGSHMPTRDQARKILTVRKKKVLHALQWLKQNNILYRNITINVENLNDLPDNDIPESLWATREEHSNVNEVVDERMGYVVDPLNEANERGERIDATVIPIHVSGVLDVNGTSVTTENINSHLLQKLRVNATKSSITFGEKDLNDDDVVYMIPHGSKPTNEYLNPNLLPGLYPTLFPYGQGGLEDPARPIKVSIKDHIRYLLHYDDKRFEKHHSFLFIIFNMMQRREACLQARLLTSKPFFSKDAKTIETITTDEIEHVLKQTIEGTYTSSFNSRINTLVKNIRSVSGNVMGSVHKRSSLRSQIHGLIFNQGLFSIFLTINPADIHHPLAMHFAGIDFDLDNILPEILPSTYERAQIIASHPVATAKFFHHLISSILAALIEGGSNGGVLGKIKAYFGTIESQGRGSLHLHILIWLDHDLTPVDLKNSVQNENFKENLITYLEDIVKEDLDKFRENVFADSDEQQSSVINPRTDLAACRPTPKPSSINFSKIFQQDVIELVEQNNIHKHTSTCFKYSKRREGTQTCRMRMPRKIIDKSEIDSITGTISMKRGHEWINNYNEWIMTACRSNMDIKFVWSGCDAKALAYYVTDYVTKSSLSFHDSLALMVKATKDFDQKQSKSSDNIHDRSRRLLLKMHNTLASQQELSGVQVASYILNFPDHYTTHEFQKIYLIAIENYLEQCLRDKKLQLEQESIVTENQTDISIDHFEDNIDTMNEQFLIEPSDDNTMVLVNSRIDYQQRDNVLNSCCLYDYISWFKKKKMDENDKKYLTRATKEIIMASRGRPANDRYRFLPEHPQYSSHILMKWTQPRVPVLVGPMVPRRERDDTKERYYRAILTLFVPWRSVTDLCDVAQTWEEAYISKQNLITTDMRRIIENIQLLHECKKDRDEHLLQIIQENDPDDVDPQFILQHQINNNDDDDVENIDDILNMIASFDDAVYETDVPVTIINSETIYFNELLTTISNANRFPYLMNSNVFNNQQTSTLNNDLKHYLIPSTRQLIKQNTQWQLDLQREKQNVRQTIMNGLEIDEYHESSTANNSTVIVVRSDSLMDINNSDVENQMNNIQSVVKTLAPIIPCQEVIEEFTLNEDQRRAFHIIACHLDGDSFLKRDDVQQQLIMCVPGSGGTGKSQLIGALTKFFALTKRSHKLRKLAPTAIAATNIDGMTIHSFLKDTRKVSSKKRRVLTPGDSSIKNEWRHIQYIFIDEISMVGLRLLARFHEILTIAKSSDPSVPFGGINIVFFGDYMQYAPVLDKALFTDVFTQSESSAVNSTSQTKKSLNEYEIQCQVGRALILQVNVVVKLTKQMRVDDKEYLEALDRMRLGECNIKDYQLFRSLILGQPGSNHSLADISWNNAPILVYRNEIRTELNNRAVINKCHELNYPLVVCLAQDKTKSKIIDENNLHRLRHFLLSLPDNKTESLPGYLPLVPGMPVLLTDNVATELGLSNGTKGIFRQIIYEELDTTLAHTDTKFPQNTIFIRKPSYALVEVPKAKFSTKFDSLEPQVVSIPLVEKTFEVNVQSLLRNSASSSTKSNRNRANSSATKITVTRKALPFVPAYSITTYKAQGQTMSKVVVDLRLPPGREEIASRYVPLGRVKSRKDIAILRDFPFSALQVKPSKAQRAELDRLDNINEATLKRYGTWKK